MTGKAGLDREYLVWDHGLYTVQRAVRTKTHLYIHTYDDYGYPFEPEALYDIVEDPFQVKNIKKEHPEIATQCGVFLTEWIKRQKKKGLTIPDPLEEILKERNKMP